VIWLAASAQCTTGVKPYIQLDVLACWYIWSQSKVDCWKLVLHCNMHMAVLHCGGHVEHSDSVHKNCIRPCSMCIVVVFILLVGLFILLGTRLLLIILYYACRVSIMQQCGHVSAITSISLVSLLLALQRCCIDVIFVCIILCVKTSFCTGLSFCWSSTTSMRWVTTIVTFNESECEVTDASSLWALWIPGVMVVCTATCKKFWPEL
jgi:hypothetical protein